MLYVLRWKAAAADARRALHKRLEKLLRTRYSATPAERLSVLFVFETWFRAPRYQLPLGNGWRHIKSFCFWPAFKNIFFKTQFELSTELKVPKTSQCSAEQLKTPESKIVIFFGNLRFQGTLGNGWRQIRYLFMTGIIKKHFQKVVKLLKSAKNITVSSWNTSQNFGKVTIWEIEKWRFSFFLLIYKVFWC